MKKETNSVVAEKKVVVKPQLTAGEIEDMNYRLQIARFLVSHYDTNMVQWQPDSWFELPKRPWFICKIYLKNGLTENCRVWQKDGKPFKIEGVGASFCPTKENPKVTETEYQAEKEKREFSLEEWLDKYTSSIMQMQMEAQAQGKTSILVPNNILPVSAECKKLVQKGLMQTAMLGGCQIQEDGIYCQLL